MMGLRQRLPHPDTWEVLCDVCGEQSSDAPRAEVQTVAFNEGFIDLPDGRWICDLVDAAHDLAAATLETGLVDINGGPRRPEVAP
jgi:hypothetical protein